MSANEFTCILCRKKVSRAAIEEHIAESHSNPEPQEREIDGEQQQVTDAEYIRQNLNYNKNLGTDEDAGPVATAVPASSFLAEVGVREDDLATVQSSVIGGGSMTPREFKLVFSALDDYCNFSVNKPSFIVNFLDWGFRNSFSEELSEAGGFDLVTQPTVSPQVKFVKVETMQNVVSDYFSAQGFGRDFTFRRLGRSLGPDILKAVAANPKLHEFEVTGTPVSNRLGVPSKDFMVVCSIYEFIKPFPKWSSSEKAAWNAFNRHVVKVSREQNTEFLPTDLRPKPSQAETLVDQGRDDFSRRHAPAVADSSARERYGKGADMLDDMIRNQGRRFT